MEKTLKQHLTEAGQKKTPAKAQASRENGAKGGRPARFRFDHSTDSVFEYSTDNHAYLFCGKLLGRSNAKFIADYERDLKEREMLSEE